MLPISSEYPGQLWKGRDLMAKGKKKHYDRLRHNTGQHLRILKTGLFLGILAFLPVLGQLTGLMVVRYDRYAALALKNQTRTTGVQAQRGVIYDRNMEVLACNVGVEDVYLDPRELRQSGADLEFIGSHLGQILDLDPKWIVEQGKDLTMRYKRLASRVEADTAQEIRLFINENDIKGIHLEPNTKRVYPQGTLAAQLLGFTNLSGTGSEGIEAAYNSFLEGGTGSVITTKGNHEMDMPFSYENYLASQPGCSVVLTLDSTVQACLEKQMENAIARYDVQNGAFGIVMEVKTGQVLAMATLGNYDPNNYLEIADPQVAEELESLKGTEGYGDALSKARLKQWRNRVISDGYEPGSTFKVLTMAAALDTGAIDLDTNFHCSGSEQIPGRSQRLHCWRSAGHGAQKTPQALQNSCNLAFAHIALKLGGEQFYEYVQRFGVLEKTGIDLNGESKGVFFDKNLVVDTDKWGTASLTSGSFGQTFKLTPLQLVRGISSVVNGGYLMEPYIVSEVIDADGNTVLKQEPTVIRQTIKKETSDTMCQLIRSVVEEGTAKNASVSGYLIGGKTGTSEKIDVFDENGQRVLDKIVSFVGIAPMDDPQYIVLVALDTPSRQTGLYISGGVMAAPTVGAVMEDILPYLGVSRSFGPEEAAGKTVILPDMVGMDTEAACKLLKEQGLTYRILGQESAVTGQLPEPGRAVPGDSQVLLYCGDEPQNRTVTVPDFMGMNRQQASDAAGLLGLYILVRGNTEISHDVVVTAQSHPKDSNVPAGTTITLEFTDTKVGG